MKKCLLPCLIVVMSLFSRPVFSQTGQDTASLGLPGDNLDLYAVLDLFQKSKTIEDFEKSLNAQTTGINNLDLDLDGKVDFIKVVTQQNGESFSFILQDPVSKTETQDVAVILVDRDKNKKVTVQIVGDEELYGKNYIVEPKAGGNSVTANPAYTGPDPVAKSTPATNTVFVESAPIVQYVYSPVYVPYVPPYYYGFYPPYFAAFTVMAVGIYRHNHYYYHGGGYGYHNTVVIHNSNHYNHYNNYNRSSSDRVQHNNANGNYGNRPSTRPSNGASASTRPAGGASASTRPAGGASASTRPAGGASASTRPAGGASASTRPAGGASASTRQAPSNFSSGSSSGGRTRSSGGGSYSGGGSRGGGGGFRGGGRRR